MFLEQGNVILKIIPVSAGMSLFLTLTDNISGYFCLQATEEVYSSKPDVKNVPPEDPDWELYTDENSFVRDGKQMTGYAVTTMNQVIKATTLLSDVSSTRAELIARTRALELSKGKKVKI